MLKRNKGIPHAPDAPLLAVKDIHVTYEDGYNALTDVSFQLPQGVRMAVVGPNGAGKSTLFKLIVGDLRPTSGKIEVYGSDPTKHLCIAYVPQRNEIDWSFPATVWDVVMMGRIGRIGFGKRPSAADRAIVQKSLEQVNMQTLAHKAIGDLSGGQQQRVFIARSLAQQAEILLLDEPLNGLDIPNQNRLLDILDEISAVGVTIIIATHDLNMASQRFDKMLLLKKVCVYTYGQIIINFLIKFIINILILLVMIGCKNINLKTFL